MSACVSSNSLKKIKGYWDNCRITVVETLKPKGKKRTLDDRSLYGMINVRFTVGRKFLHLNLSFSASGTCAPG